MPILKQTDSFFFQLVSTLCHKTSSLERMEEGGGNDEEEDELDIFAEYENLQAFNSSMGSDSSSCLDESSDDEVANRETGEHPTSPVHQTSTGWVTDDNGSEPGTALPTYSI